MKNQRRAKMGGGKARIFVPGFRATPMFSFFTRLLARSTDKVGKEGLLVVYEIIGGG